MDKKTLIICKSIHHGNTLKVAGTIGRILNAQIVKPENLDIKTISHYDLIGFGSGIYGGAHHESLLNLVEKLEIQNDKKAFIFSTSMIRMSLMHKTLRDKLLKKGFNIIGEFHCKGFSDYSFLKHLFGGTNKGRPNHKDLEKAKIFARKLQK